MACGERQEVLEWKLTLCKTKISYACGLEYCSKTFSHPCVKWCRKWGIKYPCGVKTCRSTIRYVCGFKYCDTYLSYPCIKKVAVEKYCYDFHISNKDCKGLYERHKGCCGGKEYTWSDWCLGWYDAYVPQKTCFDKPLKSTGDCVVGGSIPDHDIPGGVVVPYHTISSKDNAISKFSFLSKFGKCKKCMKLSFLLFAISWVLYLYPFEGFLTMVLAVVTTIFFMIHVVRFSFFKLVKVESTDCGCSK